MKLDHLRLKELASDEETARRRGICASCPSLGKTVVRICKECGCPITSITRIQRKQCPRGLWES